MENLDPKLTTYLIIPVIVLLTASLLVFVVRKAMNIFLASRTSFLRVNPTNYSFLNHSISFIIYFIAIGFIIYTIPELKALGEGLFAGAGIVAAILAFASQAAFANIISGIFIVLFRPFRVGDLIEIEGDVYVGSVEDITLRHTVIRDFENKRIIIPNSIISNKTIVNNNISDERISRHVEFGISYESDVDLAISLIEQEVAAHPLVIDTRTEQEKAENITQIRVRLVRMDAYAVILRAWVWTKDPEDSFFSSWDILKNVKKRFEQEGIEIPYPHHTLVYKKDLDSAKKQDGKS